MTHTERTARSTASRTRNLSPKQKAFAKAYVEKKMNGTQAALAVYDTKSPNVAGAIATENLQKPKIKEEIASLLRDNDIVLADILGIHKRNMLQNKHYPTSQKAVDSFYEILGLKNGEKATNSVQVAFIIEK